MTELSVIFDRLSTLSNGRASAPRLRDGVLSLVLDVTDLGQAERDALAAAITAEFKGQPEIEDVRIAQTAEKRSLRIIAVASGKGGVGKSTVSANLAIALHRRGVRVGLVDADIYGPSQPRLMATEGAKPQAEEKQLVPILSGVGIPMLSMGHLVEPGQAIAWRGPMAASALGQLVDAKWGAVDVLVVDMPPGTGDVQLSMIQKHKPAGVIIVSTPQDLALIDATRAVNLFDQAHVPMIGLVENMAGYICPHCGEVSDPFGSGGAQAAASQMEMPFLGRIPLSIGIRTASDAGMPPAAEDGLDGAPFLAIARKVADWLAAQG
ncbi:Mrp/NBP35 family ATP-binding protein [Sphingobium subterraneum]|uniref:Iron-sulfur cluster carrier protein n=1 Tax=Sphingobium subterraneum TaxID=627688 RepID=A0A841J1E8_9SPHN|nr:Mrp/NBP35 family ATP-binding protein [Sphingobium subterraneum]MBB6122358.1 ATP-binding protein involved in chromosome partitioning [Sphingobium subterraneum]